MDDKTNETMDEYGIIYGLIDEIEDMRTAKDYIEELIVEDAEFCWY